MVFVFKTNVTDDAHAAATLEQLQTLFPTAAINFDLEDCDNILRIEDKDLSLPGILSVTKSLGFYCAELEEK